MSTLGITVRPVRPADQEAWVRMRAALWPEGSVAEHHADATRFLRGALAHQALGFDEVGLIRCFRKPLSEGD